MAPSRKNDLSGPQASLLHAFCACNYIHLPLPRQHKTNVPVSRFTPSHHFFCKCNIMRRPWCYSRIHASNLLYPRSSACIHVKFSICVNLRSSASNFLYTRTSASNLLNSVKIIPARRSAKLSSSCSGVSPNQGFRPRHQRNPAGFPSRRR